MEIHTPTNSEQVPAALDNPSANILRPSQMAEHYNDLRVAQSDLENPKVQDKGAVRQRVGNLQRQYESQAPRTITDGATKDRLAKEAARLLEKILPGMLSQEEMRKNPAGSVDQHLRWERKNKADIKRWKKIQCVLNADNSDPHTWDRDAANLERFRPHGAQDRFRADAQITGKMSYGNVPDENWQQAFGRTNPDTSALAQAKKVHQSAPPPDDAGIGLSLPPQASASAPRARRPMTPEKKAELLANLQRGRDAKKAQAAV